MIVKNQQEALCVACEMERRAIRVYERALLLATDPAVLQGIRAILQDERQHLRTFSAMKAQCCADGEAEEQAVLSAMAVEALFPGGVMEMRRAQGLTSLRGLYTFARDSEADAVRTYSDFAEKCTDPQVRAAFESIAKEEGTHLTALEDTLATLAEN